jgi:hypothetical protein
MGTDSIPPGGPVADHLTDAVQARDRGLHLARRVQRWIAMLAVAAASGLAAFVAHGYHARAAGSTGAGGSTTQRPAGQEGEGQTPAVSTPAGSTAPSVPLQPPASAPDPSSSANVAPVVSGGS